ncbi:MAG TPA: O-antigen ligase family protein [Pyrinomonadaceae bacterium]
MTWANKLGFFLIGAIVVFTTIAYGTVHQPTLAVFYLLVAMVVVLWAVDSLRSGALRISPSLLPLPLLAAAVYGFVQVIPFGSVTDAAGIEVPRTISLDPFATKVSAIHYFALFLLLSATLVFLDSAKRIRKLTLVIAVFGFVYAFFAILQSVLSPLKIYGIYEAGAPFGSFVNRHNFAAYMEMAMALPLGLMFAGAVTRDKRLLYITVIGLMGVALLLSGSRGGLVAFVAQIIFLTMLTAGFKGRSRLALRLGLAALLVVAIVGGAIFVGGETSLTRLAETAATEDVTTGRSNIWQVTLRVILANLPFGAGFGAFGVAYTPHDPMSGLERVEQAHNDYLQVLADAGLVGLIIGAFFLWQLILQGRDALLIGNRYRHGIAIGALAGIFAILVHSIFDFVLHTTAVSVLFLMLLGLLTASRTAYDDDVEDIPHDRSARRVSGKVSSISSARGRSRSR